MPEKIVPMILTDRFEKALTMSFNLHKEQYRKSPIVSFMSHLLGVTSLVIEYGGSEDEAIAALLHDSLEDQGNKISIEDIQQDFGSNVAKLVKACSEDKSITCRQERRRLFIKSIPQKSQSAMHIIAADKINSITSLLSDYRSRGEEIWEMFSSKESILDYYRIVSEELEKNLKSPLRYEAKRQFRLLIEIIKH